MKRKLACNVCAAALLTFASSAAYAQTVPNVVHNGANNSVTAGVQGGTIGGGGSTGAAFNLVTDDWGTVSGGGNNRAGDNTGTTSDKFYATVGGGYSNIASGSYSSVGGGIYNYATGVYGSIAGGRYNDAVGSSTTVGGGFDNYASGGNATIGGGNYNDATGSSSTVGGGVGNLASGNSSTVGGGYYNDAIGSYATVPGGHSNTASGNYSFAAGRCASASMEGSFVWNGDSTCIVASANNQFTAKAAGGVRFFSDTAAATGVSLAAGSGSWASLSDRNHKANFAAVDGEQVLAKLAALPIGTWNYTGQDRSIRHIGPTAQDFAAAFEFGEDDRHINTVDADGVALSALQGLYRVVQRKDQQIAQLHAALQQQQEQLIALKSAQAALSGAVAAKLANLEHAFAYQQAHYRAQPSR
ncbi:tail fiber domain-containing protein [Gloeobacter morelensis]|uniref:Tail fiber domain-containing protein n=1 Tax=Gloeobacter morelensis MG652769 TaxID=2781736 RepID=A0ABY3PLI6_9CYAN|nr:tail fiber domain-containing protein [Gloeobacter morelensis]UFP94464.1 tail fiber domain-containing protein [Gloeobacter morelensis MG652769]